jgi:hypothetical protein
VHSIVLNGDVMKSLGRVVHFEKGRQFGFLEQQVPAEGGGIYLRKFFFSPSRVEFLQGEIRVGCGALFNVSPKPPRLPKDAPVAINVEIFLNEVAAQEAFERYQLIENAGGTTGLETSTPSGGAR